MLLLFLVEAVLFLLLLLTTGAVGTTENLFAKDTNVDEMPPLDDARGRLQVIFGNFLCFMRVWVCWSHLAQQGCSILFIFVGEVENNN